MMWCLMRASSTVGDLPLLPELITHEYVLEYLLVKSSMSTVLGRYSYSWVFTHTRTRYSSILEFRYSILMSTYSRILEYRDPIPIRNSKNTKKFKKEEHNTLWSCICSFRDTIEICYLKENDAWFAAPLDDFLLFELLRSRRERRRRRKGQRITNRNNYILRRRSPGSRKCTWVLEIK